MASRASGVHALGVGAVLAKFMYTMSCWLASWLTLRAGLSLTSSMSSFSIDSMQRITTVLRASMCAPGANTSGKRSYILRAIPRCCLAPISVSSPSLPSASACIQLMRRIRSRPRSVSLPMLSALCSVASGSA